MDNKKPQVSLGINFEEHAQPRAHLLVEFDPKSAPNKRV